MTKNEYMTRLTAALSPFSTETQQEVLEDYETHFAMGLENGKSEEEICLELGSIELFIDELKQLEPPVSETAQSAASARTGAVYESGEPSGSSQDPAAAPKTLIETSTTEAQIFGSASGNASGNLSGNSSGSSSDNFSHSSKSDYEPDEYHASNAAKLVLEGLCADVSMSASRDGQFHIYYENNGSTRQKMQFRFYFRQEGDTIYTGVRKSRTMTGLFNTFGSPDISLEVEIPSSMTDIQASTVSGEMKVDGLGNPQVSLSTTNGDMTVSHMNCERLELGTVNGDIDVDCIRAGYLKFNSTSGDYSGSSVDCQHIEFVTTSGDLELSSTSAPTCHISTVSGDADINGKFGFCKVNTISGDIELNNQYAMEVKLNTVSGDITLYPSNAISGKINTVSGDVDFDTRRLTCGLHVDFSTVSGDLDINCPCNAQHFSRGGSIDLPGEGSYLVSVGTTSGDITIR